MGGVFYADSIDLKSKIENIDSVWSDYGNIIYKNGRVYLKEPIKLSSDSIHTKLHILHGGIHSIYPMNIRCWIDNEYKLEEINSTSNFLNKIRRYYYNHYKDSVEFMKYFNNPILYNDNKTTYYVSQGFLYKKTKLDGETKISNINIIDPMYNQMIIKGKIGFIRSGNKIMMSDDSLKTWRDIYWGPRQIKESMYWRHSDSCLIFSQYTPGVERKRHYILEYKYKTDQIDTAYTFYTEKEYIESGLYPCARHIHVLTVDPFTGWLFVGTGDTDLESAIYVSKDDGQSFTRIGGGSQVWRTLSFVFTDNYILWNTDSDSPQYLSSISRSALDSPLSIDETAITRYPLFNSALWNTIPYGDITIMTSNVEGALYDNSRHIFGIKVDDKGTPTVYNLWDEHGDRWSSQLFPIGVDCDGVFQFYDTQNLKYRYFILVDKYGNKIE